ncbi:MAG: hypothetical protein AAF192_13660, partial [Pseudomonadota bacterium]
GWSLKPSSSSHFAIHQRRNGQFCAVLNHALLRGVSAEMIHWWFRHFATLKVRLRGVPGYEDRQVPAYWLWHPFDHLSADLSGPLAPDGTARAGCSIRIREAMQHDRHGWKYPVDAKLKVVYVAEDGWAMGKFVPVIGPVMMLRIHFKDVVEDGRPLGVHYHYEVVIGASGGDPISRFVNRRVAGEYGPEFFEAWQRHNVIEVGTFENFLPALFAQRGDLGSLDYASDAAQAPDPTEVQRGWDEALFERRLEAYAQTGTPHAVQAFDRPTFL